VITALGEKTKAADLAASHARRMIDRLRERTAAALAVKKAQGVDRESRAACLLQNLVVGLASGLVLPCTATNGP